LTAPIYLVANTRLRRVHGAARAAFLRVSSLHLSFAASADVTPSNPRRGLGTIALRAAFRHGPRARLAMRYCHSRNAPSPRDLSVSCLNADSGRIPGRTSGNLVPCNNRYVGIVRGGSIRESKRDAARQIAPDPERRAEYPWAPFCSAPWRARRSTRPNAYDRTEH